MHLIAPDGLRVLGSRLPAPRRDVHAYVHDVGVAWLWLAARRGTFGPLQEIVGERRHALARRRRATRLAPSRSAVKLGGVGPRGASALHYPDLLLRTADGRRVALELELSSEGPRGGSSAILAGYAADPRIDGVVYLVESAAVARIGRGARRAVSGSPRWSTSSASARRCRARGRGGPRRTAAGAAAGAVEAAERRA